MKVSTSLSKESSIGETIPKLHQLDLLEGNGKSVKLINVVASNWDSIALRLHFEHFDIEQIKRDYYQQCALACRTMFSEWLDGKGRSPASWNTLIKALRESQSDHEKQAEMSKIIMDLEYILGTV